MENNNFFWSEGSFTASDSDESSKDPFLKEQPIFKTQKSLNSLIIIKDITANPYTNIYQIAKRTGLNYSTVHRALKSLVFSEVVFVKSGFDSQNRVCELFFIPKVEAKRQ